MRRGQTLPRTGSACGATAPSRLRAEQPDSQSLPPVLAEGSGVGPGAASLRGDAHLRLPSEGWAAVLTLSLPPRPPDLPRDPALGDDGEAATSKPTLPDLSPDEPSEALGFPTLEEEEEEEGLGEARGPPSPARSSAVASPEPAPAPGAEEASSPTAEEGAAADPGSDGSPGKSPSKKKKKFRTPSFLKKSKKRSDC